MSAQATPLTPIELAFSFGVYMYGKSVANEEACDYWAKRVVPADQRANAIKSLQADKSGSWLIPILLQTLQRQK